MATRREQKDQTRVRLLEAALELFSAKGITATRTLEVAQTAGVSHGTVFVHFGTRDELVVEVISSSAKRIVRRIQGLVERGASVRDVLAAHLEGLSEHEAFYAKLIMEGPLLPPSARHTLLGIQSVISKLLESAATPEMEAKRIRPQPFHLLFNTWLGLVHHYVANRDQFAPGESVLLRCGEELLNHYMGLLAP